MIQVYSNTIPGLLEARVEQSPESIAHCARDLNGTWRPTTWKRLFSEVSRVAACLEEVGIRRGGNIGIMAHTSRMWECLHIAISQSGGVVVGIDPYDTDDHVNEIAGRAKLSGLVIDHASLMNRISDRNRSNLDFILCLHHEAGTPGVKNLFFLDDLLKEDMRRSAGSFPRIEGADPATIIFTSGTTGSPKGIMYTHEQVTLSCRSIVEIFYDMREVNGVNLVCWLPLSNLFQRLLNLCAISIGASLYFVENPREIVRHLPLIKPHVFIGVPRFFEKLYDGVREEIDKRPWWVRTLINKALDVGALHSRACRERQPLGGSTELLYHIAEHCVLKHLRERIVGANLRYMISGSAPMPEWLLERFHALGILILEAYGISENVIPIAINRPHAVRFGTVGKQLGKNEIKLRDDGELLVKGPGLFSGYYNDQSAPGLLTPDGYLATGDYAMIDENGYIALIGRKSEIFKTSTGRRIAPAGIEAHLLRIPYVEHAIVLGAGEKFLVALLSINRSMLPAQAHVSDSLGDGNEEFIPVAAYDTITRDVMREVDPLPNYQQPVGLLVTARSFTVSGGELTSNLKLRRAKIVQKYQDQIHALYAVLKESDSAQDGTRSKTADMVIRQL